MAEDSRDRSTKERSNLSRSNGREERVAFCDGNTDSTGRNMWNSL